jgi:rod shape-determining protein MreD
VILVVGYGLTFGKKAGMISGLMAGMIMDVMFANVIGYYTIPYMYIGFLNGILNAYFNYDNFIIPSVCCAVSEFVVNLYIFIFSFALRNRLNFGFYLEHIIVPEIVYTVVISLILFRLQAYLNQKIMLWEKRRGVKIV